MRPTRPDVVPRLSLASPTRPRSCCAARSCAPRLSLRECHTLCPAASVALEAPRPRLPHTLTPHAAVTALNQKLLDGLDSLEAASAQSYLDMSLSLTAQEREMADQALAHRALKADVVGKTNPLVRMQFDEQQASVRAVVSCKSSSNQAVAE